MFEHDEIILEAKHVTRRFPASDGRTLVANDDINLKFYKGKTLGLVGESGCGKSTFMRFLVSLDTPEMPAPAHPSDHRQPHQSYECAVFPAFLRRKS